MCQNTKTQYGIKPVSYTHLLIDESNLTPSVIMSEAKAESTPVISKVKESVSYTHLDVYKRQKVYRSTMSKDTSL